jgi:hypothetical protein
VVSRRPRMRLPGRVYIHVVAPGLLALGPAKLPIRRV